MATSATVKFYDTVVFSKGEKLVNPILTIYHHSDGYLKGLGYELALFLKDKKILNGYSDQSIKDNYANGMGCLASQYVAFMKKEIGQVYAAHSETYMEYNYQVFCSYDFGSGHRQLHIRLEDNTFFEDTDYTPEEFLEQISNIKIK